MEHVVFFPAAEGTAFRRLPTLEEAVRLVEHLRNVEGIGDVSLHALTEVPLSFRAYYRVEVPTAVVAPEQAAVPVQAGAPSAEVQPAAPPATPQQLAPAAAPALALVEEVREPAVEEEAVPAPGAGRGKDSAAGLGFFA